MMLRRVLAFLLIVVEALALAIEAKVRLFLWLAVAFAAVGSTGWFRLTVSPWRLRFWASLLAYPFFMVWLEYMAGNSDDRGTHMFWGLLHYSNTFLLGHYFMALQILRLFVREAGWLGPGFAFYGALAMACAGNVRGDEDFHQIYLVCSLLFVGLMALFLASQGGGATSPARRGLGLKYLRLSPALLFLLYASAVTSWSLYVHRYDVHRFVNETLERLFQRVETVEIAGPSDSSQLSSVSCVRLGTLENKVVLRVFSESVPGYLRGRAYDMYDAPRWEKVGLNEVPALSVPPETLTPSLEKGKIFLVRRCDVSRWQTLTVWSTSSTRTTLHAPLDTAAIEMPAGRLFVDADGGLSVPDSEEEPFYFAHLAIETRGHEEEKGRSSRWSHLSVPPGLDVRVRSKAEGIFKGCRNTPEKVAAVEQYFHSHYRYSRSITIPEGWDPLTWFLVAKPPAFCEYFASGAAILLRLGGVPTRYVSGLLCAEWNPYGKYWMARRRNAHAWVEAFDAERKKWITVEATPPGGLPVSKASSLSHLWDLLSFRVQELLVVARRQGIRGVTSWSYARMCGLFGFLSGTSSARIAAFVAFASLVGFFVLSRRLRKRAGRHPDPLVRGLQTALSEMERRLRRRNLVRRPSQTLHDFAGEVLASGMPSDKAQAVSDWYRDFAVVRYRGPITAGEVARLRKSMSVV